MNRNIVIGYVCWLLMLLMIIPCTAAEEKHDFGDLHLAEQWSGDFDGMQERRVIRVLVTYNKMLYFVDQGQHRGVNIDFFAAFAKHLSEKYKRGVLKTEFLFLPVERDQLLPALADGRGDIAAANLTITWERKELVDFSAPLLTGVTEIIITAPGVKGINSLEDLAGKEIHLRKSSSYYQHILKLNEKFINKGLQPVTVITVNEFLEDSDLLEMVNADLIPIVAVDDHKAQFWGEIFENISLHPEIAIHSGGEIGWAIRKDSPKLAAEINDFLKTAKKGTLLGNIVYKRYLKNNKWARNALDKESQKRYQEVSDMF
ncbi:MAG: membrane-bound lytic murein transglycosylase MltF [Desulforhopalus sp.]